MNILKKQLAFLLFSGIFTPALSQIGINTTTPDATLDVRSIPDDPERTDGVIAPKLTGAQLKAKDSRYGISQDGTIVYVTIPLQPTETSSRTTNVLDKGYYSFDAARGANGEWVRLFHRYSETLAGGILGSANTGGPLTLSSVNASNGSGTLVSKTITLVRPGLVTFTFSIPITNINLADGSNLSGGNSKLLAANIYINGGNINNYLIVRSGISIANGDLTAYTNSGYQINGTRTIRLEAGTYTVNLNPLVFAQDSSGVQATFGDNTYADTIFDIISYPLP